ncbi:MAG: hypothetical protein KKD44_27270 [Proteobacteria bacterium]|nr:hypothetical protein [Pseudomonadota bacterium]
MTVAIEIFENNKTGTVNRKGKIVGYVSKDEGNWTFTGDADGIESFSIEELKEIIKWMVKA